MSTFLMVIYGAFGDNQEIDLQPNSVITHGWVYEAGQPVLELLIAWRNRPVEKVTWETYDLVAEQFSEFRLEDKAFYRKGSHRCITGTLKVLEAEEDMEEPPVTQFFNPNSDQVETAEFACYLSETTPYYDEDVLVNKLKLTSKPMALFGVQIGNGDIIRCNNICKNLPVQYLSFGSIAGNRNMVQTRNSEKNNPPDPIATQLAVIATKLEVFETIKEDIAALKEGEQSRSSRNGEGESSWRGRQPQRPYNKIDFLIFSSGDPHGWLMKAKKYFRYYQIPDEEKVEIALMHLEGDALDLYSWLSHDQTVIFWEELVQAFTRSFGLAEFQNSDEFLC
nr:retrotransposon Gag domain, retroviral aspartyl protease [Tanacetum cinerariifolium]